MVSSCQFNYKLLSRKAEKEPAEIKVLFHTLSLEFLSNKHLLFPQGKLIQTCPLNLGKHRAVLWEKESSMKVRQSQNSRGVIAFAYLHSVNFSLRVWSKGKATSPKTWIIQMYDNESVTPCLCYFLLRKIKKQKSNKRVKLYDLQVQTEFPEMIKMY